MNWQVGLYLAAILIPLLAFLVEILGLRTLGKHNAFIATGAVGLSFVLSLVGFIDYFGIEAKGVFSDHSVKQESLNDLETEAAQADHATVTHKGPLAWTGSMNWVSVGQGFSSGANSLPPLSIPLSARIDNLTVILFLLVTFVATLVHIYSISYMRADPRAPLYFAYLSLFVVAMLGLLIAANLFLVFVCWELVGLCSYLLIGFWRDEKANSDAANKAYLVNRVGDVGLLLGLGLLWTSLGTVDIDTINRSIRDQNGTLNRIETEAGTTVAMIDRATAQPILNSAGRPVTIATWALALAGFGVLAGCAGKSAQFPLHVWLPDAMAGPTPVSALIHAATMVAAGVYLVGRFYPIFTDEIRLLIAYMGGITLLIGASIAVVQTDYKKVLAYSTVSQLGFMMLGLGVGGWAAGMFHLATHACFKALLFLGAGSLHHAVHTYDMRRLGGLAKKMPVTAVTMLIATLAISGVPFLSGFYSKDAILASALFRVSQTGGGKHFLLFLLPVFGSALTAFYMFRMWLLCFSGHSRSAAITEHAHESDPLITWPLIALAVPSIFLGWTIWLGLPIGEPVLEQMLAYGQPLPANDMGASHFYAMIASVLLATAGIGAGLAYYAPPLPYLFQRRFHPGAMVTRFRGLYAFLLNKWHIDDLYDAALVRPTLAFARDLYWSDRFLIDPIVNGVASLTRLLSRGQGTFDRVVVDGLVGQFAALVQGAGNMSRRLQTGRLRHYLLVMALATVSLGLGIFAWVQSY